MLGNCFANWRKGGGSSAPTEDFPARRHSMSTDHTTRLSGWKEIPYCSKLVFFRPGSSSGRGGLLLMRMNCRFGTQSQKAPSAGVMRDPPGA
jgi:hypothetical protein